MKGLIRWSPLLGTAGGAAAVSVLALPVVADAAAGRWPVPGPAMALLGLLAAIVVVVGARVPGGVRSPSQDERLAVLADLPPQDVQRGRQYGTARFRINGARMIVKMALLAVFGLTSAGAELVSWASAPDGGSWTAQVLLGGLLLGGLLQAVTLVFGAWQHAVDRRYEVSTKPWSTWIVSAIATATAEVVVYVIGLGVFYTLGRVAGPGWWMWGAGIAVAATVLISLVSPVVGTAGAAPLPEGSLRRRALALAEHGGVRVAQVYAAPANADTGRVRASVYGIGPARIVLSQTLLPPAPTATSTRTTVDVPAATDTTPPGGDGVAAATEGAASEDATGGAVTEGAFTEDQVLAVLGHELVHVRRGDLMTRMLLSALLIAAFVCAVAVLADWSALLTQAGASSILDPHAVALLLLTTGVGIFLIVVTSNLVNRRLEARADEEGLTLTGDAAAAESAFRRALTTNPTHPDPGWPQHLLTDAHPRFVARIAALRARPAAAAGQPDPRAAAAAFRAGTVQARVTSTPDHASTPV